ncbi:hypothetical protein EMIT047CA2_150006 [Pseudomonas soli]
MVLVQARQRDAYDKHFYRRRLPPHRMRPAVAPREGPIIDEITHAPDPSRPYRPSSRRQRPLRLAAGPRHARGAGLPGRGKRLPGSLPGRPGAAA